VFSNVKFCYAGVNGNKVTNLLAQYTLENLILFWWRIWLVYFPSKSF